MERESNSSALESGMSWRWQQRSLAVVTDDMFENERHHITLSSDTNTQFTVKT